jgi:hypothetical protein
MLAGRRVAGGDSGGVSAIVDRGKRVVTYKTAPMVGAVLRLEMRDFFWYGENQERRGRIVV